MVEWPALLKLEGDDELFYFGSEQECVHEVKEFILSNGDHLIDSQGHAFVIEEDEQNRIRFVASRKIYTLDEITQLIQKHEFNAAQVCITKIVFLSIEDAVWAMKA
ncbi:MAG: DUF4144 family protein [Vibrio sp.]|uniref:DUF4144 family protein n=1 Tax=Vibrio sp. TaxID=678 RepID=UPI003A846534